MVNPTMVMRGHVLDLGCGPSKVMEEAIGIDHYPFEGVDIVRDLTRGLPFSDGTCKVVIAKHILEHFDGEDLIFIIDEIWRVLQDGGLLEVVLPCHASPNRYRDPTHKTRDWHPDSFMFWEVDEDGEYKIHHGPAYNIKAKYALISTVTDQNLDIYYQLKAIKND